MGDLVGLDELFRHGLVGEREGGFYVRSSSRKGMRRGYGGRSSGARKGCVAQLLCTGDTHIGASHQQSAV